MTSAVDFLTTYFSDDTRRNVLYILLIFFCVVEGILLAKRLGRETAPDTSRRQTLYLNIALTFIIAFGAALRFYGLDFGLPTAYHPDELQKAHFLHNMMRDGSLNPNFSLQPPLLLYLSWAIAQFFDFIGIYSDDGISRILLAGRAVSAIAGTVSLFLVYAIGRRISSPLTGVLAALLLAVFPLHIANCRYMKEDALFIMFALACVLSVLKSVDEKKLSYLYLAGLLAGFSLGAKYTGVVSFIILLAAPFLGREKFSFIPDWRILRHALLACLLEPVGFAITAPYVIGSWENIHQVLEGFGSESRHAMRGHMGLAISAKSQLWMYHFGRSLLPGISLVPMITALLAVGVLLRKWNPRGLFLIALVLLFYLPAEWANSKPPPQPDRYVMACTPFLAILAAELIRLVSARLPRVELSAFAFAGVLAVFPLTRSVLFASEIKNDTRRQMTQWLADNLPAGTKVLLSGGTTYLCRIPQKLRGVPIRKALGRDDSDVIKKLRESGYPYLLTTTFNADGRFSVSRGKNSRAKNPQREIEEQLPVAVQISPKWGSYGFHNPTLTLYSLKDN